MQYKGITRHLHKSTDNQAKKDRSQKVRNWRNELQPKSLNENSRNNDGEQYIRFSSSSKDYYTSRLREDVLSEQKVCTNSTYPVLNITITKTQRVAQSTSSVLLKSYFLETGYKRFYGQMKKPMLVLYHASYWLKK